MTAFLKLAFSDNSGVPSSTRIMSFLTLLYAFFYTSYSLIREREILLEVLVLFMVAAFAPKLIHKYAERGGNGNGKPTEVPRTDG